MDLSAQNSEVHLRTDANNLVTTASTTHLPEQKETIHMINQLRHEACSGSIHDLAHVVSQDCLSDCLTKQSAKSDILQKAVDTGILPNVDKHPPFREMMKDHHKAYLTFGDWLWKHLDHADSVTNFMGVPVQTLLTKNLSSRLTFFSLRHQRLLSQKLMSISEADTDYVASATAFMATEEVQLPDDFEEDASLGELSLPTPPTEPDWGEPQTPPAPQLPQEDEGEGEAPQPGPLGDGGDGGEQLQEQPHDESDEEGIELSPSTSSSSSSQPREIFIGDTNYFLLTSLQIRALQWVCRILVIKTNRAGGPARWREEMAFAEGLIEGLPMEKRAEAREMCEKIRRLYRSNVYSTWRPGVVLLASLFLPPTASLPASIRHVVPELQLLEWQQRA